MGFIFLFQKVFSNMGEKYNFPYFSSWIKSMWSMLFYLKAINCRETSTVFKKIVILNPCINFVRCVWCDGSLWPGAALELQFVSVPPWEWSLLGSSALPCWRSCLDFSCPFIPCLVHAASREVWQWLFLNSVSFVAWFSAKQARGIWLNGVDSGQGDRLQISLICVSLFQHCS